MGNAFTFLKSAVASLDRRMEWSDMQNVLLDSIDAYERERIQYADKAISEHIAPKIVNGDVILVYGFSEVVLDVLLEQHLQQKQFRVIVVDSRPLLEGKRMLLELRKAGIECSYILLNALSYVLEEVTKVILGAAALMSDGSVLSRVGTACVATLAAHTNKAVLVCCETYKISHRVQLESITSNELGNPQNVLEGDLQDNLRVINLYYDLTPSQFVSGIVTEMGILPPTSVAVLLREMNPQETDSTMMM
jgi:translation initiation factor eIF-2B subunit delta